MTPNSAMRAEKRYAIATFYIAFMRFTLATFK
jgi:hypothetical protein